MNFISKIFSAPADASRIHPAGILLMLAAVILALFAEKIARRFPNAEQTKNTIKIVGLILCAGGALLAILG